MHMGHLSKIQLNKMNQTAENIIAQAQNENRPICFKCKKCRTKIFDLTDLVKHPKENQESEMCDLEYYINPLDWFKDRLEEMGGKINCPKCESKLGSFDWCGSKCACGAWVTPAFHISKSKVDSCRV